VPQGNYYTVDPFFLPGGDAAAPPYRPLQPRYVVQVDPAGGPVHGILWKSGGFTDYLNFNPVISRPTVEWEQNPSEPQVCYRGFWPSEVFRVNTMDDALGNVNQTVVVTPGQFRCDLPEGSAANTPVTGTQRIFNVLGWEMLRSTDPDVTAPSLTNFDVDLSTDPTKPVQLKISAIDPLVGAVAASKITRVVVLRVNSSSSTVDAISDVTLATLANPLVDYTVNIANPGNDRLIIQIIDAAGNVGLYTAKGPGLRILNVDLGPDRTFSAGQTLSFTANVNLGGEPMVGPVNYFWDFGGGNTLTTSSPTTTRTFSAAQAEYTVKVKVTDSNGGIGVDSVKVRNYCLDTAPNDVVLGVPDAADLTGCSVSVPATGKLKISLATKAATLTATTTAGIRYTISTSVTVNGVTTTNSFSYREGKVTGVAGLQVDLTGNTVNFTFDQAKVGWAPGRVLTWSVNTQGGISSTPGAGQLDRMPDVGAFSYPNP